MQIYAIINWVEKHSHSISNIGCKYRNSYTVLLA